MFILAFLHVSVALSSIVGRVGLQFVGQSLAHHQDVVTTSERVSEEKKEGLEPRSVSEKEEKEGLEGSLRKRRRRG